MKHENNNLLKNLKQSGSMNTLLFAIVFCVSLSVVLAYIRHANENKLEDVSEEVIVCPASVIRENILLECK
jgi:hypothetical protein